tara:strand:+ start:196 stop:804 length:609 start_codon:yes stop_codon:yes gene_type:complete
MSGIIAQNVGRHTGLIKAAAAGGEWTLISTVTSDGSDATISFTSGIDSTYDEYCFKFINIHAETESRFTFQGSIDGGSNYNVACTSTLVQTYNNEDGDNTILRYAPDSSSAQGTSFVNLSHDGIGDGNDANLGGILHLYDPANTTFVKHWHFVSSSYTLGEAYEENAYSSGYFNTTSAIDAIQFKMASDEIQGGSISLYGIG